MGYFNKLDIIQVSSLLNNKIVFFAHLKENNGILTKETISEHTDLVNKYFMKIVESKNIDIIFENYEKYCFEELSESGKKLFRRLLINVPNFHDIGKLNPNFQQRKMKNDIGNGDLFINLNSTHSILSAILYIDYFLGEIKNLDRNSKNILIEYLFLNAYIISRHHGNLDTFENFLERFYEESGDEAFLCMELFSKEDIKYYNHKFTMNLKEIKSIVKYLEKKIKNKQENASVYNYVYVKLVFSLLVASDFYATSEFMNNAKVDYFGEIYSIDEFCADYKNTKIYKSIREYEKKNYYKDKELLNEKDINILRNEMFLDAEKELTSNIYENIFFLEAPTGSGKSNVALNLTFKLLENTSTLRKIYHVYPFNTLIEQNKKTLDKIFGEERKGLEKIAVINSITPIYQDKRSIKDDDEEGCNEYYTKAFLDRQFLNYPMILTTHVSLFNTMFNSSKESVFAFHQLANSVVVLDEIQSYKNIIWSEIIIFLKYFAKLLNIKIIIMSATLPNLNYLTVDNENTCRLIKDREKYFSNPLFKDRVEVDYSLMDKSIDEIYNHLKNKSYRGGKILIEFIKKSSAYEFYNRLKEDDEVTSLIELITGDDNPAERKRILDRVENTDKIILVATQVIEAGVDIDMDIGYKDISKLDSDEQFMGRINRSCKRSGIVFFFDYDDTRSIYKEDVRVNKELSLINDEMKKILTIKEFSKYYMPVLEAIKNKYNNACNESNIKDFFREKVGKLNFKEVEKKMELISDDTWSMSVYLAREFKTDEYGLLNGSDIWIEYKKLLENSKMNFSERAIKLSEVRAKMNYFIYSIKKSDIMYNDRIGEIYYIEDGYYYFKDGKIDKDKLITGIGDFI